MTTTPEPEGTNYAKHGKWIHTQFGRFYIESPEFKPEAIAYALGQLARYNGHSSTLYTVAEHSLLVAGLMAELKLGDPFEGLLHDAAEAYFRDIAAPWKQFVPDSVSLEHKLERQIREHFNLPLEKTAGCDRADKLALFIEAYYLMPDRGADFTDLLGVRDQAMELVRNHWRVHGLAGGFTPELVTHLWMKAYKHYGPKIEVVQGLAGVEAEAARASDGKVVEGSSLVIP